MMEGLDPSYDAVVFLGYHAAMSHPACCPTPTTRGRSPSVTPQRRSSTGEAGLNALVAQHLRVPVAVITGDQYVGPEVAPFCPGIATIEVKRSISRYAAEHLHPAPPASGSATESPRPCAPISSPPRIALPATVEVELLSPDMAEQATWIRGVARPDSRTVSFTDDDPLRLFRTFMTLVFLTRSLVEPR